MPQRKTKAIPPEVLAEIRAELKRPPLVGVFDVLYARSNDWQERKRLWKRLGIKSELGRPKKLNHNIQPAFRDGRAAARIKVGTSVFDPVLCEVFYRLLKPGQQIIDPFAGGSVRGIVASVLGLQYWGVDLSEKQIEANIAQLDDYTTGKYAPKWYPGDAYEMMREAPMADMAFSCPPYGDLEVYSKHPCDLSNMPYDKFIERYTAIVKETCEWIKPGGLACFVVSDFRNKQARDGSSHPFKDDTKAAFAAAGMAFIQEVIFVTPIGTAAWRAAALRNKTGGAQSTRFTRTHQSVLCFKKPDAEAASDTAVQKPFSSAPSVLRAALL